MAHTRGIVPGKAVSTHSLEEATTLSTKVGITARRLLAVVTTESWQRITLSMSSISLRWYWFRLISLVIQRHPSLDMCRCVCCRARVERYHSSKFLGTAHCQLWVIILFGGMQILGSRPTHQPPLQRHLIVKSSAIVFTIPILTSYETAPGLHSTITETPSRANHEVVIFFRTYSE